MAQLESCYTEFGELIVTIAHKLVDLFNLELKQVKMDDGEEKGQLIMNCAGFFVASILISISERPLDAALDFGQGVRLTIEKINEEAKCQAH